jgi:hypothetical protein
VDRAISLRGVCRVLKYVKHFRNAIPSVAEFCFALALDFRDLSQQRPAGFRYRATALSFGGRSPYALFRILRSEWIQKPVGSHQLSQ